MKYLLLFLALSSSVSADSLIIKVFPPPKAIDWSTPQSFMSSTIWGRMSLEKFPMGHSFVEIKCGDKSTHLSEVRKLNDSLRQFLFAGSGLGILFHSYEGELLQGEEALKDQKERKLATVEFKLNPPQCKRLTNYLEEYQKFNVGKHYGPALRPLYGEGSSSSSFAASFLEVLNLMDMDLKAAWTTTVNVPMDLSGPPLREEGINILKVYFLADSWAKENEPHRKLNFYDPEKMYLWMKNLKNSVVDKSYLPASQGHFWLQFTDPQYRKPRKL
jgi:hypothetical protein